MDGLVLTVEASGRRVQVEAECTLGRAPGNTLAFPDDETMSREHARVRRRSADYVLSDMGTRNGSFLERGGKRTRVTEIVLALGDVILVGTNRVVVSAAPEDPGAQTVIRDPGLTSVPDATRVGDVLPDLGGAGPAPAPKAPSRRGWWRRLREAAGRRGTDG